MTIKPSLTIPFRDDVTLKFTLRGLIKGNLEPVTIRSHKRSALLKGQCGCFSNNIIVLLREDKLVRIQI